MPESEASRSPRLPIGPLTSKYMVSGLGFTPGRHITKQYLFMLVTIKDRRIVPGYNLRFYI